MRCIRPLKASQNRDGELTYSSRKSEPGLVGWQFDCRKCLPCRLNQAREKAIRALHEAKMHEDNIFLTLTYDDANLESPRLIYDHFQNFMKDLRYREAHKKIPYMVTGEYGDQNKRPHWHALLFNYRPCDAIKHYTTDRGDTVWHSKYLQDLWGRGNIEFGSVTLDSASYVARYSAKKLTHGNDQDHDYHPIHKTSSKHGIGRSWIEKHYKHAFSNGFVTLPDGQVTNIPRYYVDWAKNHRPDVWRHYVTEVRPQIIKLAESKQRKEDMEYISDCLNYKGGANYPMSRPLVKETILKRKFKQLQEHLKL